MTEAPLRDFLPQDQGINVLLLHASDMSALPEGTMPLKPLTPDQVRGAGFKHALLGHYHGARTNDLITYPGSPQPLSAASDDRHCIALVTVADDGNIEVRLDDIVEGRLASETIDITGMTSRDELIEAVRAQSLGRGEDGLVKLTLIGQRSPALDLDARKLAEQCRDAFPETEVEDRSQLSHDLEAVAQEFTSRGEMVRKLVERQADSIEDRQAAGRALQLALDAFQA
jgi:DNA repair exonuclease SbcCD nuclease subunit